MEAQVLSLLEYYSNIDEIKSIKLIQGCKNTVEKKVLLQKVSRYHLDITWFKTWPKYTYFYYPAYLSISNVLGNIELDKETIIHVRGEYYGGIIQQYLERNYKHAQLLVDIRGASTEEVSEYYTHYAILKRNKIRSIRKAYKALKQNVRISVVSSALRSYLVERHGFNPRNIVINPNLAGKQFSFDSELRQTKRKELNIKDEDIIAICSSGSGAAWQKDHEMIPKLSNQKIKILNLSSKRIDLPHVINISVPFHEVPSYLAAADMAILWRDTSIVNEVASPSKFSEFACMGLWIIHNGTVKLATDYILNHNAGIIIMNTDQIKIDDPDVFSIAQRLERAIKGWNYFGVKNIASSYLNIYNKIYANLDSL